MSLVPELLVTNLAPSLAFWRDLCGFTVAYDRPEEGFAYLTLGDAHVMLEQEGVGRNWLTGPLDRPLGRGINLQIAVDDLAPILARMKEAKHRPFLAPETKYYRVGDEERVVRQFLVTDPDGYLLRFQQSVP